MSHEWHVEFQVKIEKCTEPASLHIPLHIKRQGMFETQAMNDMLNSI